VPAGPIADLNAAMRPCWDSAGTPAGGFVAILAFVRWLLTGDLRDATRERARLDSS
jgi:hypothetical protein